MSHLKIFDKYLLNYKAILQLGFPIFIGQLGNIAVGFADNIMVGHYSTDALASASFVNNVFNIAVFCIVGFTYGLTPLAGALYAKKDNRGIGALIRNGLRVNLAFTILVILVMTALYFNIDRLGQPEHLLPIIRPYYLIFLAGMIPVSVFNLFAQWSYSVGDSKLPTWIILSANIVNVIGNYALIYGNFGMPELGLTGAGISTFVARMICPIAIVAIFMFRRSNVSYREGFVKARFRLDEAKKIFVTSFPVSMQMSFETAAFSGAAIMAGWLGAIELAAFQIIVITGMLGFCIYYSFGAAVSVLVAHRSGKDDNAGMRRVAWAGYHVMLSLMTMSSLTFIIFGEELMGIFSNDTDVVALAATLIFPLVLYQVADATQINFANALRGTGHVMPMLYIAFFSYIVIGLPATYVLAFTCDLKLYGIILSFSVSLLLAAVFFLTFFIRRTSRKS